MGDIRYLLSVLYLKNKTDFEVFKRGFNKNGRKFSKCWTEIIVILLFWQHAIGLKFKSVCNKENFNINCREFRM